MIYICIALYILGYFSCTTLLAYLTNGLEYNEKLASLLETVKQKGGFRRSTIFFTATFWPLLVATGLLLRVKNLFV